MVGTFPLQVVASEAMRASEGQAHVLWPEAEEAARPGVGLDSS